MNDIELIKKAKKDMDARSKVVEANTGLVWSIVKRFYGRGYETDDLFQLGCIGLIKAIDRFDDSFGVQFSTYAVPMILGEIKRFLRDDGIIKVSRSLKQLNMKINLERDRIIKKTGNEPTTNELAELLGVTAEEIVMAVDASVAPDSLQRSNGDDDSRSLEECLETEDNENTLVDKIMLKQALSRFEARERQIIIMRYFCAKTQSQIAESLGISQVQVSRLEKKILESLRNELKITG